MAKNKRNPILDMDMTDLWEKDPESLTDEDLKKIALYHRTLREEWAQAEQLKAEKKAAKARKDAPADPSKETF